MPIPHLFAYIQGLDVVSADQLNTYTQTAQNTVQLRSFTGLPGMQVDLQGTSVPNDGGGGSFYWNPTALGPDDNSTVIVPQPGIPGAWVRLTLIENQVVVVPNIAALRNLLGGPSAEAVWVEGYYTPGDGGGGAYTYITSDLTSADNGGTIIIDAQNHRYYSNWHGTGLITDKLFGAHVDGVTDDSTFIQNAINYLESVSGGKLTLVHGTRVINAGVTINTGGITIEGTGWADMTGDLNGNTLPTKGSIVYTALTAASPFTLTNTAAHTNIRNIAFRQNQPPDVAGWGPNVYPPSISILGGGDGSDTLLENIFFWNCYAGIQIGSTTNNTMAGRVTMRHIWGMPIAYGIDIQQASYVVLDDVVFVKFSTQTSLGIGPWILANGIAIRSAFVTGPRFSNIQLGGYQYGIVFQPSIYGVTSDYQMANVRIINCQWGIGYSGVGPANTSISGQSSNFVYDWNLPYNGIASNALVVESGAIAQIMFSNFTIGGATDAGISLIGGASGIAISNLIVAGWNLSGNNQPAILAAAGSIVTLSGRFLTAFGGGAPNTGGAGTFNISHVN